MKNLPDPIETIRAEAMRRLVENGIFTLEQIQRENGKAPDDLPYCRLTIPQAADFNVISQKYMEKTIMVEFDVMTRAFGLTQTAGMYATAIEDIFGMYDRELHKQRFEMANWKGVSAVVTKYGRGSAQIETEKNIFYLPVLIYVQLTIQEHAAYGG